MEEGFQVPAHSYTARPAICKNKRTKDSPEDNVYQEVKDYEVQHFSVVLEIQRDLLGSLKY